MGGEEVEESTAPGVPDPQPDRSSLLVLPPLAGGGTPRGPSSAVLKCLHLPGSPCGRRFHPRGLPPLLPLSFPQRDYLISLLPAAPTGWGVGTGTQVTSEAQRLMEGASQERLVGSG